MKKNGFTLVELLAVIVILAILVLMAIPAYNSISNNVKKKHNENVVKYIELQAEKFVSEEKITSDTEEFSFTVGTLVSNGYLDEDGKEDNQSVYYDGYHKNIICNEIKIYYSNNKPHAKYTNNNDCDLNSQNFVNEVMDVEAYKSDSSLAKINYVTLSGNANTVAFDRRLNWVNSDVLLLLNIKNNDKRIDTTNIKSVTWTTANNKIIKSEGAWLTDIKDYTETGTYLNAFEITTANILDDNKIKVSIEVEYEDKKASLSTYVIVRIDKQSPTLTSNASDNWTMAARKITLIGDDKKGSGINYFCVSENRTYNPETCERVDLSKGSKTKGVFEKYRGEFYAWAIDNVGNISDQENPAFISVVNIDNTAPECVISNESTTWAKERTIKLGCTDTQSGCKTKDLEYKISDGTTKTKKYAYTIEDKAGNKTNCSKEVNVYVDNTKPTCNVSGASTDWAKSRTITIQCNDNDSGCTSESTQTYTYNTSKVTDSKSYQIKDNVGNTATCSQSNFNVYVDNDAPVINGTSIANGAMTITLSDATSGVKGWQVTTSQTAPSNISGYNQVSGNNIVVAYPIPSTGYYYIHVIDQAGNVKTSNQILLDITKPTCVVSGASTSWAKSRTITIQCNDSDSGCTNDSTKSYSYTATTKTDSKSYQIKDNAGNTATCSQTYNVYVDTTLPTIQNVTASGKTFSASVSDNAQLSKYEVYNASGSKLKTENISGTSGTVTYTATQAGNYSFAVYDQAGNRQNKSFTAAQNLFCAYNVGQTWKFSSINAMQTFTVPCAGTYNISATGGTGGKGWYIDFSAGTCSWHDHIISDSIYNNRWPGSVSASYKFTNGQVLYVNVGGSGGDGNTIGGGDVHYSCSPSTGSAGYNGGSTFNDGGGTGGATTIALINGNYSSSLLNSGKLLLCAKGGAGLKSNNYIHFESMAGAGTNYINSNSTYYVGSPTTNNSLTNGSPNVQIKLVSISN